MGEVDPRDTKLAALRRENAELREKVKGMRLVAEMRAGPMRLEAVSREGKITFTMCFDNDVMAHMGESAARLFADFVNENLPSAA